MRSAGVIDSSTTRNAMETDSSRVMRSAGSAGAPGRLLIHSAGFGRGPGEPLPAVALGAGGGRAELVEADAAGDRGQPGARGCVRVALVGGEGLPAGGGFLDRGFRLRQGSPQAV